MKLHPDLGRCSFPAFQHLVSSFSSRILSPLYELHWPDFCSSLASPICKRRHHQFTIETNSRCIYTVLVVCTDSITRAFAGSFHVTCLRHQTILRYIPTHLQLAEASTADDTKQGTKTKGSQRERRLVDSPRRLRGLIRSNPPTPLYLASVGLLFANNTERLHRRRLQSPIPNLRPIAANGLAQIPQHAGPTIHLVLRHRSTVRA